MAAKVRVLEVEDSDRRFLAWLHARLEYVHGESENLDYMHRLRAVIAATPLTQRSAPSFTYTKGALDIE